MMICLALLQDMLSSAEGISVKGPSLPSNAVSKAAHPSQFSGVGSESSIGGVKACHQLSKWLIGDYTQSFVSNRGVGLARHAGGH